MQTIEFFLGTFERLFTIFFVTITTLELKAYLVDHGINPIRLQLAGIALMLVLVLTSLLKAWKFVSKS